MALVLTSPSCVAPNGTPRNALVKRLRLLGKEGSVALLSRSPKPDWFDSAFGDDVLFFRVPYRGNGEFIKQNAERLQRSPHEMLVLAGNDHDIALAKNGGAVLIGAGWSDDPAVARTGLRVKKARDFDEIARLLDEWPGSWFWQAEVSQMRVRALADLSTYYKPAEQEKFGEDVTDLVKEGGPRLTALTALLCRSYLSEDSTEKNLAYALYPSSSSNNDDTDTLSQTLHAFRTVTSQVRFAKRDEPILVRHRPAPKRSSGGTDRGDPTDELNSLHVNTEYRGKLRGRVVVLLDDCTTHGLSFSVARTLLLAAGAEEVLAIALGKLGNRFVFTDIKLKVTTDCYKQGDKSFSITSARSISGTSDSESQSELIRIFTDQD